eukprot:71978-Chlamydomonas_euryale.AAC.1
MLGTGNHIRQLQPLHLPHLELVWRAQRRVRRARLHHVADADALRGAPDLAQLVERAWSLHVARVGARVDVQIGPARG